MRNLSVEQMNNGSKMIDIPVSNTVRTRQRRKRRSRPAVERFHGWYRLYISKSYFLFTLKLKLFNQICYQNYIVAIGSAAHVMQSNAITEINQALLSSIIVRYES